MTITRKDIEAAATVIQGSVVHTPTVLSPGLSRVAGMDLYLKLENLQHTGSFKVRGALNKLTSLHREETTGIIACSAGNHGQGVAYFADRLGFPATIVMPKDTPFTKIERTERYGAKVVLEGDSLADAQAFTNDLASTEKLTFIHPYDDPHVIAGQGTIGLEMLADLPELDTIVVPVGGGGLIAGIATAAKAIKPDIRIIGVETASYPSMRDALAGRPVTAGGATLAEGIAVKTPGAHTLPIIRNLVDQIIVLDELAIENAVELMADTGRLVVEGAGAVPLGAVLAEPDLFRDSVTGLVVSGGNIDMRVLASVLLRGLVRGGQLVRLRIQITDAPGNLAQVTQIIGKAGGNIVEIVHQRLFYDVPVKQTDIDVVIETRNASHTAEIQDKLEGAGWPTFALSDIAASPPSS
ncbi:MAG: threonine ammonia-lyase [Alphaproteobacteria bacterium]|nr:threonine ammonia-lyase [Alphaproteobacteria bacterium]